MGLMEPMGLIALISLLAACSAEGPDLQEQERRAVGFGTYTEQFSTRGEQGHTRGEQGHTRAEVKGAIADGEGIGVYAYYHDGSTWEDDWSDTPAENKTTPNFMWNQQCTYSNDIGAFTYAPLKYWPNEESDKLSFMAYYPYTDPAIVEADPAHPVNPASTASTGLTPLLTNSGKGLPSFTFTVKDYIGDQVDLLVSDLIADLPQSRDTEGDPGTPFHDLSIYDKVKFLFHHALAKVEFRIVADEEIRRDLVNFRLNSLSITNIYKSGTLTPAYAAGNTTLAWSGQGTPQEYAFTTYKAQLLLPQTIDTSARLNVDYTMTFKSDGTTYHYVGTVPVADTEYTYSNVASLKLNEMKVVGTGDPLTTWLPNHHYIYKIRLRANRIDFTGEVVDWGEYVNPLIIDGKDYIDVEE